MSTRVGDFIYNGFMLPLEKHRLNKKRAELLESVSGNVLEVGFGTGVNMKFFDFDQISRLTLVDTKLPTRILLHRLNPKVRLRILSSSVTSLPFKDNSFDNVVFTLVFCSVDDPIKGLKEIYRVLKPGGKIYFMEHVLPTKEPYKGLFKILTPQWAKISHGCHLNRDTITHIAQAGFRLETYHRFYKTSFISGIGVKSNL